MIKISKIGTCQPCLVLPFFNDKPELCLALTLKTYLTVTQDLRKEIKNLFITIKKPYKAVSSQSLSRWVKAVLISCGIDKEFTAHSVRHAVTSKALKNGLDRSSRTPFA